MPNDPLTDIIHSLNLTGAVFLNAQLTSPWAITAHVTEEDCRPFLPIPQRVIAFHLVTKGEAIASTDAHAGYQEHYRAKPGDVIILPSNAEHVLASDTGLQLSCGDDLLLPAGANGLVRIRTGGCGQETEIFCGFLASDSLASPLLDSLPSLMVIEIDDLSTRRWIEASIAMASQEQISTKAASQAIAAQLSELMLIKALRTHLETSMHPDGWLAGMADKRIARALACIHSDLASPPAVPELAAASNMSRSAFVDRFTQLMGVSPRAYILDLRIQTAGELLRTTRLSLAEVAQRVGYSTPEAFSRAFKRATSHPPAHWRIAKCNQETLPHADHGALTNS